MTASLVLSLCSRVSVEHREDGTIRLEDAEGRLILRRLGHATSVAFGRLAEGDDEDRLADAILADGGPDALAEWYYGLNALDRRGWIHRSLQAQGKPLATLVPCASPFEHRSVAPHAHSAFLLSRFAYLRRDGNALQLESPTSLGRVVIHDPRLATIIAALSKPATLTTIAAYTDGLEHEAVWRLFGLLASVGLIVEAASPQPTVEESDPALRCWEFHDLLFHARSRRGRTDAPLGATFRMAGALEPLPAIKPSLEAETISLARPELERFEHDDPPFARVLESRRSIRQYADEPISLEQLAEFLFRVGRLKATFESEVPTDAGPVPMVLAARPYPSGGALYELDFYAAVQSCRGIRPGLYRYQSEHHRLGFVAERTAHLDRLIRDAAASAGIVPGSVQVVLVLSARFPRMSWKYASIAYALILKHVGVVYQTMYLAATAMGLAPCALGAGDSDLFARVAGTDYYAESSVGEFLLGSRGRD